MFFVNHDEAEILKWREHSGPGADQYLCFAGFAACPSVLTQTRSELGMAHDNALEPALKARHRLRGEANLWHEH